MDGYYSDSLTDELRRSIDRLVFVNIDVDIYRSTIELLDFIRPLLRLGVILYWDDWKDPRDVHDTEWGEHLAWEYWVQSQPGLTVETIEINSVNQRTMIVTMVDGEWLQLPRSSIADIRYHALELADFPGYYGDTDSDLLAGIASRKLAAYPRLHALARSIRRLLAK